MLNDQFCETFIVYAVGFSFVQCALASPTTLFNKSLLTQKYDKLLTSVLLVDETPSRRIYSLTSYWQWP
jgi:hypothetical protein